MIQPFDCDNPPDCIQAFAQPFDDSPFPVVVAEVYLRREKVVYVNSAFTQLTGYDLADIVGKSCAVLQQGEGDPASRAVIQQAIQEAKAGQAEFVNYRKDGSSFINLVRVMPLHTNCVSVRYMLGLQLDVSEFSQRLARDYERHEERLTTMGRMSTAIAHEINNPIAGVLMNLEYLSTRGCEGEVQEIIEESLAELVRVTRLIKSMLAFERHDVTHYLDRVCSVHCILEEAMVLAEPLVKTSAISLSHDFGRVDTQRYHISVMPDQVIDCLLGIMRYSVQSMAKVFERRLMLDCFPLPEKRQVLVRVTDTGMPVSEKLKERLVNEVFSELLASQLDSSIIAIAKRIRQFGGLLAVDEQYHKGSRFLIYLPLLAEQNPSADNAYLKGKYEFI